MKIFKGYLIYIYEIIHTYILNRCVFAMKESGRKKRRSALRIEMLDY